MGHGAMQLATKIRTEMSNRRISSLSVTTTWDGSAPSSFLLSPLKGMKMDGEAGSMCPREDDIGD